MVNQNDLDELRRISTNTYNEDKACMNRVIKGISLMASEIHKLKLENERLQTELNEVNKLR